MNNKTTFAYVKKIMSSPFQILPLVTELLKLLKTLKDEDVKEIYEKYPELKVVVYKLVGFFEE